MYVSLCRHASLKTVSSPGELMQLVQAGADKRVVGRTALTLESSRSHMIISLVVYGLDKKTGAVSTSKV